MGQVINIENSRLFGARSGPYSAFNMNNRTADELVLIKLPLEDEGAPADVLVLVKSVRETHGGEISVVMAEIGDDFLYRNHVGGHDLPSHYVARSLGSLSIFMSKHAEEVDALVLAGSAAYGNLTMARGVWNMVSRDIGATEALNDAVMLDHTIRKMHQRQAVIANAAAML